MSVSPMIGVSAGALVQVQDDGVDLAFARKINFVGPGVTAAANGPVIDVTIPGGASYFHTQAVASASWTINHNLGRLPAVSLLSPGYAEVVGDVVHTNTNQVIAHFAVPQTGFAICT